jgi:hypothetical protein
MSSVQTTKQFSEKYKLGSPFDLDNDIAYHAWLENKMDDYPQAIEDIVVEVSDTKKLSIAEFKVIRDLVKKTNMAIYAGNTGSDPDKAIPVSLANQFGLSLPDDNMGADDGITALRVAGDEWRGEYIPYTNRSGLPVMNGVENIYLTQTDLFTGILMVITIRLNTKFNHCCYTA